MVTTSNLWPYTGAPLQEVVGMVATASPDRHQRGRKAHKLYAVQTEAVAS